MKSKSKRLQRLDMLREIDAHEGISEHSAALTFKRGDLSWARRRKLIAERPFRSWIELYLTEKGRQFAAAQR